MSEISLGDLIQAVARLGLQGGAIREAAESLGLPLGVRREAPRGQVMRPEPVHGAAVVSGVTVISGEASSSPERPAAVPAAGDDLLVRNEGRVPPIPPAWAQAADTLRPAAAWPAPELPPLLSPATTRALLAALIGGVSASGPLDVERVIAVLARGRALEEIPRLCLPTLRYGVQILVDRAAALLPYREDQQKVVADLRLLLPPDRVQVLRFAGSPLLAGPSTPHTWRPYVPPPAGSTVLVLSDLGLCRGEDLFEAAPLADWIDFAARVRRAGARATALVPYEARRWPAALRSRMTLVSWDRPTTVAEAHARSRRGGAL